ncbi:outer membrane beta-barrel protein [Sinomicrobium weinanense]|uniref:Outer membrane beta-barrel protein n=1 Tax=Sinomicrobium weinanense TaxID=2842200 RepID=A0A926Q310_9FLAO|nr:outer membrane beta-barrel protein [Sinomicrobium weinanense]MBC9797078.1 outer membrane beta-barrel protein [Sinomicrobium weinanense]MBU3122693.1 outer membrane beta-barrel protein [Sinomicrobium weinanense]
MYYRTVLASMALLWTTFLFSQNTVDIRGTIIDAADQSPLESATVYLTTQKDSTVLDYTISNRKGSFSLEVRKTDQPAFIKISFIGYKLYSKSLENLNSSVDLGTITLAENADELAEVVVQGEAPPIQVKKDTLEFNASSFKVRPDSNVETLLKQLPGVEVDSDGKITVNGKEVNKVLVNGKPFFGKDGQIATKNLPSDIINKIQVSDTKTKEEELSGEEASSDEKTINLTIQKDKNKGYFGRATAGYGTDERYEGNLLVNYFNDDQRISVLAGSNNINSIGFSMDEIFDAMGGGRNVWSSGSGGVNINGVSFGATGSGITTSHIGGITYADDFLNDKLETDASYFYTQTSRENDNRTEQQNLTPEGQFTSNSENTTENESRDHSFSTNLEFKPDSLTTIGFSPTLNKTDSDFSSEQTQFSVDENGELLNESEGINRSSSNRESFQSDLFIVRRFKRKGRYLNFRFGNNNSSNDSEGLNKSSTIFHQNDDPDDIRDQKEFNENQTDNYSFRLRYNEPITDSLSLTAGVSYDSNKTTTSRETLDFDETTGSYTSRNDPLSNYTESKTDAVNPTAGLRIRKKNLWARINLGTNISDYRNASLYMGDQTRLKEQYIYPTARANIRYEISKGKSIYINYNYRVNLPSASQLLPVEDLSNPLSTTIGNPDLRPTKTHSVYFNFNNYDFASRSGIFAYGNFGYDEDKVVSVTTYDDNFKRTTTYQNLSGTYSGYAGLNWNASKKKEEHTFRYRLGVNVNFSLNKGITNNENFKANNISLHPSASFAWEYGELLTVEPSYNFNYNESRYTNYRIDKSSNFRHNFKIQTTSYWPENIVFGNDFGYTYNSNIADGFQKSFWLWNSSIGYNFMKEKMTFKVKVYDILDQNVGTRRNISDSYIQDVENTVLQRYVMFSLSCKLDKFGGKKPKSKRRFYRF